MSYSLTLSSFLWKLFLNTGILFCYKTSFQLSCSLDPVNKIVLWTPWTMQQWMSSSLAIIGCIHSPQKTLMSLMVADLEGSFCISFQSICLFQSFSSYYCCAHFLDTAHSCTHGDGQTQAGNRKRSTILRRLSWNPAMSCVVLQKNPACLICRKLLYAIQTMHHLPAVTGAERSWYSREGAKASKP